MALSILNLNRAVLMNASADGTRMDYLSAKYKNIRYELKAQSTFKVIEGFAANLPTISYRMYQTTDYWWVIGMFNGIIDPLSDVTPGTLLQIPAKEDVDALVSSTTSEILSTVTI